VADDSFAGLDNFADSSAAGNSDSAGNYSGFAGTFVDSDGNSDFDWRICLHDHGDCSSDRHSGRGHFSPFGFDFLSCCFDLFSAGLSDRTAGAAAGRPCYYPFCHFDRSAGYFSGYFVDYLCDRSVDCLSDRFDGCCDPFFEDENPFWMMSLVGVLVQAVRILHDLCEIRFS